MGAKSSRESFARYEFRSDVQQVSFPPVVNANTLDSPLLNRMRPNTTLLTFGDMAKDQRAG
jgi:hypothetical protein